MTEQNPNPDITDDTEGHARRAAAGPGDVEGLDSMDDDTEGHVRKPRAAFDIDDEDDVEGHGRKSR
jgi:hypothetical protein